MKKTIRDLQRVCSAILGVARLFPRHLLLFAGAVILALVVCYIVYGVHHAWRYYQERQPLLDARDQLDHYHVTKQSISNNIPNLDEQLRQNEGMRKIVLPTYISEIPGLEKKEKELAGKLNGVKKDIRAEDDEVQKLQTLVKVVRSCSEDRLLGYEGALSSARCLDISLREYGSYLQGLEEFEALAKWVIQVETLTTRWKAINGELYKIREELKKWPEQRARLEQQLRAKQKELESVNRAIVENQKNLAQILRQLESRLEATQNEIKMLQAEKMRTETELDALQECKASILNEIEQYKKLLGHVPYWKINLTNLDSDAKKIEDEISALESQAQKVDKAINKLTYRIDLVEKSTKRDFRSLWLPVYVVYGIVSLILQQIGFAFAYRYAHERRAGFFQLLQDRKAAKWLDYISVPMSLPSQLLVPKAALSKIMVLAQKVLISYILFMIVGLVPLLLAIVP